MKCRKEIMRLYAVTDSRWSGESGLLSQIKRALAGGITCLQLREKKLDDEAFLAEAIQVKKLCGEYHVPLIINDNIRVAKACGADGVHIGLNDTDIASARAYLGDNFIIGASAHNAEEAIAAERNGADYLGAGAVFGSSTKTDANTLDHAVLREICRTVSVPVVAIGGITLDNASLLAGTGIDGIAVISAIFAQPDIEESCRKLLSISAHL